MKKAVLSITALAFSLSPVLGQTVGSTKAIPPSGALRGILAPIRDVPVSPTVPSPVASHASGPTINCRVPLTAVGTINVGAAVAVVTNTSIDVLSEPAAVYSRPLLSGLVLRTESDEPTNAGTRKLTGLAVFMAGSLVAQMRDSTTEDIIFRAHGASIEGQIIGNDATSLLVRQKDGTVLRVNAENITFVRSPRAFLFNILGTVESGPARGMRTDARSITFQPTGTTNGVSLSSVVRSKDEMTEEEDSLGLGKFGPAVPEEDDMPSLTTRKRPFPFWP